jgi:hypothetical protein
MFHTKMKPENSYKFMEVTAILVTMGNITESDHRSTILGAHLFIRFITLQHNSILMLTECLQTLPKMISSSLNEWFNFVTPRISDMLQNSRHVLYWSHSCFNQVPNLILDVCSSLGGEAQIIFMFGHGSHNTWLPWAIHFFKKEVICSCAQHMLTVWPVKTANSKVMTLFCSAQHAINGTERRLSFEVHYMCAENVFCAWPWETAQLGPGNESHPLDFHDNFHR